MHSKILDIKCRSTEFYKTAVRVRNQEQYGYGLFILESRDGNVTGTELFQNVVRKRNGYVML